MLSIREMGVMMRAANVRLDRTRQIEEARFYSTLNAFGIVMVGKKWKWVSPQSTPKDFGEREKRAYERHLERRRKKWHSRQAIPSRASG